MENFKKRILFVVLLLAAVGGLQAQDTDTAAKKPTIVINVNGTQNGEPLSQMLIQMAQSAATQAILAKGSLVKTGSSSEYNYTNIKQLNAVVQKAVGNALQ